MVSEFYNCWCHTDLYGTIPIQFCYLKNLVAFIIYGNYFNGAIPECLFNLPKNVSSYWCVHMKTNKNESSNLDKCEHSQ